LQARGGPYIINSYPQSGDDPEPFAGAPGGPNRPLDGQFHYANSFTLDNGGERAYTSLPLQTVAEFTIKSRLNSLGIAIRSKRRKRMHMSASHTNRRIQLWTLLALLLLAACPGSTYAATTTAVCANNIGIDRVLIQAAINNSVAGDTIELIGTCQLDGTAIFINTPNLTIKGPGAAGNWTTVVSGLTDLNGIPLDDGTAPSFLRFNRGLSIGPRTDSISGITIQGIKFANLNSAVDISPSIGGNSNLCSGMQITSGNASYILVTNNWFDNDRRAVSNIGLSHHINITANLITNSGFSNEDILSEGGFIECFVPQRSFNAIQFPSDVSYQNNVIKSDHAHVAPIFAENVQSITIIKNAVTSGVAFAPILFIAQEAHVSQNVVNGLGSALAGIFDNQAFAPFVPFPTLDHQISNNSITNISSAGIGIGVDSGIFGTVITNNQFDTSGVVNILLCDANANASPLAALECSGGGIASHDNLVITTHFGGTVLDLGSHNKVIGRP